MCTFTGSQRQTLQKAVGPSLSPLIGYPLSSFSEPAILVLLPMYCQLQLPLSWTFTFILFFPLFTFRRGFNSSHCLIAFTWVLIKKDKSLHIQCFEKLLPVCFTSKPALGMRITILTFTSQRDQQNQLLPLAHSFTSEKKTNCLLQKSGGGGEPPVHQSVLCSLSSCAWKCFQFSNVFKQSLWSLLQNYFLA